MRKLILALLLIGGMSSAMAYMGSPCRTTCETGAGGYVYCQNNC